MTGDTIALIFLGLLGLVVLSLVPAFVAGAVKPGGIRFQPLPAWPMNAVLPLLTAYALWTGLADRHWVTMAFLGAALTVLALQYLLPKRWDDGKVWGVWYGPAAVRSVDRTSGKTVLILAGGYKLDVPAMAANQALLAQLAPPEEPEDA
jgi:PPE-repeat protein